MNPHPWLSAPGSIFGPLGLIVNTEKEQGPDRRRRSFTTSTPSTSLAQSLQMQPAHAHPHCQPKAFRCPHLSVEWNEALRGGEQSQEDKGPPVFSCSRRHERRSHTLAQTRARHWMRERRSKGERGRGPLSPSKHPQGLLSADSGLQPGFTCPAPEHAHKQGWTVTAQVKDGSFSPSTSMHNLPQGDVTERRPMIWH